MRLLAPVRNRSNGCRIWLVCAGIQVVGGGGSKFRRALKFHNPDFVRGSAVTAIDCAQDFSTQAKKPQKTAANNRLRPALGN